MEQDSRGRDHRDALDASTRERETLNDATNQLAKQVCRLLTKFTRSDAVAANISARGALSCREWALANEKWLHHAAAQCTSSGALILTTQNIDEVEAIVRSCEPLKTLCLQHLAAVRDHLSAEETRHERLLRVTRQHRGGLQKYGQLMFGYLRWIECLESSVLDRSWSVACNDTETLVNRRNGTSGFVDRFDSTRLDGFLALATTGRRPAAACFHALVSELRDDCRRPPSEAYRELLQQDSNGLTLTLTRRPFPASMGQTEKRGLAFAMLVATCSAVDGTTPLRP